MTFLNKNLSILFFSLTFLILCTSTLPEARRFVFYRLIWLDLLLFY